jgi:excisionase family DNA binding protein
MEQHAMTRREAAQALRVTTRTLDTWLRDPRVPLRSKKLGKVVRVSAEDVARLLDFGPNEGR